MALVKTLVILKECEKEKFAVGAFNINGLDQPAEIVKRANKLNAPILMVIPGVVEKYVDFEDFAAVTARAARDAKIPVGIHLSHGGDLAQFERAAKAGFTSIMIDGSSMEYEENVRLTKKAVEIGHKYGAAVEGELGAIGSSFATIEGSMTDPQLALDFVKRTGVDILAVSIGNTHGFYKGTPKLDFTRLDEIRNALEEEEVFLTLHGGTGIPKNDIQKAIKKGIVKICIYTELCVQGKVEARKYIEELPDYIGNYDVPELYKAINHGFTCAEEECIKTFMSDGHGNMNISGEELEYSVRVRKKNGDRINQEIGPIYPSMPAETHRFLKNTGYWNKNV